MIDSRAGSNLLYLPLDRLLQKGGASSLGLVPPPTTGGAGDNVATPPAAQLSPDIRSRENARTRDREGR